MIEEYKPKFRVGDIVIDPDNTRWRILIKGVKNDYYVLDSFHNGKRQVCDYTFSAHKIDNSCTLDLNHYIKSL